MTKLAKAVANLGLALKRRRHAEPWHQGRITACVERLKTQIREVTPMPHDWWDGPDVQPTKEALRDEWPTWEGPFPRRNLVNGVQLAYLQSLEAGKDDAGAMSGPHAGRPEDDGTRTQPEELAGSANPTKSEVGND